jgi:hypothetical protein
MIPYFGTSELQAHGQAAVNNLHLSGDNMYGEFKRKSRNEGRERRRRKVVAAAAGEEEE